MSLVKVGDLCVTSLDDFDVVFRYVKPSHISSSSVLEEVFQLRENRSPPEEYLSFYYSSKAGSDEQLAHVKEIMTERGFSFKSNGGFLELSCELAKQEVNKVRNIIDFVKKERPNKIGMHYVSSNIEDVTEAKTLLVFLSKLHPLSLSALDENDDCLTS